jgi:hypothetical protein
MINKNEIRTNVIQAMVEETAKPRHPMTYTEAQAALLPDNRKKLTKIRILDIIKKIASL